MAAAAKDVESGALDISIYKRLKFTGEKFESCLQGIDDVVAKKDPVRK